MLHAGLLILSDRGSAIVKQFGYFVAARHGSTRLDA
jgi:hypothetical protein